MGQGVYHNMQYSRMWMQLVKIFVLNNNPQITKAQIIYLSKFKIIYFFELSMLVGISEAIRLLLANLIKFINLIKLILFTYILKYIIISRSGYPLPSRFKWETDIRIKYSGFSNEMFSYIEKQDNSNSRGPNGATGNLNYSPQSLGVGGNNSNNFSSNSFNE